jgi:hypothetical protein
VLYCTLKLIYYLTLFGMCCVLMCIWLRYGTEIFCAIRVKHDKYQFDFNYILRACKATYLRKLVATRVSNAEFD